MPRAKRKICTNLPYHVGARCLNREWFRIPLPEVWEIFSDYLFFLHHGYGIRIHSFVLMDNHFHLLLEAPEGNLASAMNYFLRETSRIISRRSGRINQVYGGPYHASLITNLRYYMCAYKYIYRNPVEGGLCGRPEAYPYSTLSALLGLRHSIIPLIEDEILFSNDVEDAIRWLNDGYRDAAERRTVKNALRKGEFKFAKQKNGKPHRLETEFPVFLGDPEKRNGLPKMPEPPAARSALSHPEARP